MGELEKIPLVNFELLSEFSKPTLPRKFLRFDLKLNDETRSVFRLGKQHFSHEVINSQFNCELEGLQIASDVIEHIGGGRLSPSYIDHQFILTIYDASLDYKREMNRILVTVPLLQHSFPDAKIICKEES